MQGTHDVWVTAHVGVAMMSYGAGGLAAAAGVAFIGSHPRAGSEKQGMEHASGELFRDATCILTNDEHVDVYKRQQDGEHPVAQGGYGAGSQNAAALLRSAGRDE